MKRQYFYMTLLLAVIMFPFVGNVSTADALGNYECGNSDTKRKQHVRCLRAKLDSTPYGLTVPKGKRGLGKYGCGRKAGNKKKIDHVNCLKSLLDQHGPHLAAGVPLSNPDKATPLLTSVDAPYGLDESGNPCAEWMAGTYGCKPHATNDGSGKFGSPGYVPYAASVKKDSGASQCVGDCLENQLRKEADEKRNKAYSDSQRQRQEMQRERGRGRDER